MRTVATWFVGLCLALFLVGVAVVPLTVPAFTRIVAERTSLVSQAGLTSARMTQIAEQVRRFVIDEASGTLPATVDGRAGFDAQAVSHLADVRNVLAGARLTTGVLALALSIVLAIAVARRRTDLIADALAAGAWCTAALVVLCVIAATFNFEAFFSAFHGLFFKAGTWTFPEDSLLIQTFPEAFWATAGATWGALVLAGAGALALGARALRSGQAPSKLGPSR